MSWPESRNARTFWTVTWPLLWVEWAIIPHVKEESLSYLLIKKILNFCLEIANFKHVFESCRPWRNLIYILVCHSVNSYWISGYYNPIWRGYLGLSYDPNCFNIRPAVLAQKLNYMSKKEAPRPRNVRSREQTCDNDDRTARPFENIRSELFIHVLEGRIEYCIITIGLSCQTRPQSGNEIHNVYERATYRTKQNVPAKDYTQYDL